MYILHIPSWTPDEDNPMRGNFIERHIAAISSYVPCITLQFISSKKKKKNEIIENKSQHIIVKYYLFSHFLHKIPLFRKLYILRTAKKALSSLTRTYGKPAAIHLHVAYPFGLIALATSKKYKIPLFLTEHWSIYHRDNIKKLNYFQYRLVQQVFKQAVIYTAVSEQLRHYISSLFPDAQGVVIPNVVDTTVFKPALKEANRVKTMVHISTLDEASKNISGLLRAVHELHKIRSDFILNIIHERKNDDAEQYVVKHQLTNVIHFLGRKTTDEVSQILQTSDFLVQFSNYETFGCVVAEALASGKPVVTSAVPAILEMVTSERGIVVPINDEKALTLAMQEMLDNFHRYSPQQLFQFINENFTPSIVGKQFNDMYRCFINEKELIK